MRPSGFRCHFNLRMRHTARPNQPEGRRVSSSDAKNPIQHLSGKELRKLLDRYRVTDGKGFSLKDWEPGDTAGRLVDKAHATALRNGGVEHLSRLQEKLYAQDRWSVLCVFQAMDAAGKDGTIKHVLSGVNPQGVTVTSFKAPSPEELKHDFLWRAARALPERGRIGIFNRSHYEETLVVRVHPELLDKQHLPPELNGKKVWDRRLGAIAGFEQYLADQGTVILKFFLHISKEEQAGRFRDRQKNQDKHWKLAAGDFEERKYWDDYQEAYEKMLPETSTEFAPWYIIPADRKWTRNYLISHIIAAHMEGMNMKFPELADKSLVTRRFR